jgi:MFS family permease
MATSQPRAASGTPGAPPVSLWQPFSHPIFAALWIATVISNVGWWMYTTGSAWLMTSLNPNPLVVSLIQVATSLPTFLFAIPAGALADIIDQRRFLIVIECGLTVLSVAVAGLVSLHAVVPGTLLLATFLLGTTSAFEAPPWQAIVPRLVPRDELTPALAANGIGINVSRAIGPALAGVLLGSLGITAPFWVNAVANIGVIAVLVWWRPSRERSRLPAEHFLAAMVTGVRYVRYSQPLRAVLVRAVAFFAVASAEWSLLPLVARERMAGGPAVYGALLGAIGVGAMATGLALPRLRTRLGPERSVVAGTAATAVALALLAVARAPWLGVVAGVLAGCAWTLAVTSLGVTAQLAVPDWVRARGLAVYITVFFGAMTLGSAVWGQVAAAYGLPAAYGAAALTALAAIPATRRWRLSGDAALNLTPAKHWDVYLPAAAARFEPDRGPALVTIEYRVDDAHRTAFLGLARHLSSERRRDGAYAWGIFEDTAVPGRFLETFLTESWLEHLRQHERVTATDWSIQEEISKTMSDARYPIVTHYVAPAREAHHRARR